MTALETLLSSSAVYTLGSTLLHFIWQGASIAIVLAITLALCRSHSPQLRYMLSCAAMLAMILAPIITFQILYKANASVSSAITLSSNIHPEVTVKNGLSEPSSIALSTFTAETDNFTAKAQTTSSPNLSTQNLQQQAHTKLPWLVFFWATGVLILSIRLLSGWAKIQTIKSRATQPSDPVWQQTLHRLGQQLHIRQTVRLLESAWAKSPMVIGWLKPVILIPSSAMTGLPPQQIEAILAHELAHIRRYDYLINIIQSAQETLFFYHPAVWWVSSRLRIEREYCCDDAAIEICGNPITYARTLADLESQRQFPAVAANDGALLTRVQRLLGTPSPTRVLPNLITLSILSGLVAGTILFATTIATAQSDADTAIRQSRTHYFQRDFDQGIFQSIQWLQQHPNNVEIKAWQILHLLGSGKSTNETTDVTLAQAQRLTTDHPRSPWSWFAFAEALNHYPFQKWTKGSRSEKAIEASEKALKLSPNHIDLIWMHARTLKFHKGRQAALTFIDKNIAQLQNPAELLVVRGWAQLRNPMRRKVYDEEQTALAAFEDARKADPQNVNAHYLPGVYLSKNRRLARQTEGLALLKKAANLSPHARDIHDQYWQAINKSDTYTAQQKKTLIHSDIDRFQQGREQRPETLLTTFFAYRNTRDYDKADGIGNQILQLAPQSDAAEQVLTWHYQYYAGDYPGGDAAKYVRAKRDQKYRDMLRSYIQRPKHFNTELLANAYHNLYFCLKDDPFADPEELLSSIKGMIIHDLPFNNLGNGKFVDAVHTLTQYPAYYPQAEQIAKDGIEAMRIHHAQKLSQIPDAEQNDWLFKQAYRQYNALGWIYLKQGRLTEAEALLLRIYNTKPTYRKNLYQLGQLYELKKDTEKAEKFYTLGRQKS